MNCKTVLLTAMSRITPIHFQNVRIIANNVELPVGHDSKLVSKIYEIIAIQQLESWCNENSVRFEINKVQNAYPDCIMYSENGPIAVDIKTSYIVDSNNINGFTLGTYKGYFQDRGSTRCTAHPYKDYLAHFCICILYDRTNSIDVKHVLLREKWQIAAKRSGSGNTTNIGSITKLRDLLDEKPLFEDAEAFDKYWLGRAAVVSI